MSRWCGIAGTLAAAGLLGSAWGCSADSANGGSDGRDAAAAFGPAADGLGRDSAASDAVTETLPAADSAAGSGDGGATGDASEFDAAMAVDSGAEVDATGGAIADRTADATGGAAVDVIGAADGGDGARSSFPAYPLKTSANKRYLVDQNGTPYLIAGDAPQALIGNLTEADADFYMANRQMRGFNTLWINLLCDDYTACNADGSTFDGIHPFTTPGDFSTPNEAYFARADAMIKTAAKYGLQVFLDPAETGGWLKAMLANGVDKCRAFGRYLGNRYKGFDNIVWMSGNDFQDWRTATSDAVVTAVALGIRDVDARHIHTIELDYNQSNSLDDPNWAPIISLNSAYTYYPTYARVLHGYNTAGFDPVFMVEAVYEFESNAQAHTSTPSTLRREEYWTNLSGATGQLYGSHYTWTFTTGWKTHLDSPGALQMVHVKELFEPRAWYALVPDQDHSVVTAGYGTFSASGYVDDNDYATAARTPDGKLVMVYVPTLRALTVDMTKLSGPATARWFDPANGKFAAITGSPFANTGTQTFTPQGKNSDGDPDWVLVIESP
jgi:hypothetical protein